jgi:nucleoside-diphosphate-sugar epimerase
VVAFHRGTSESDLPDTVQHVHGDRARLSDYAAALCRPAPDVVLDLLAMTERDAQSVVGVFRSAARRLVVVSSGDVYRAFGRLIGTEPGPPDPTPLAEDSPLRERRYPYREQASGQDDYRQHYDKILVERAAAAAGELPATVLRLPMTYGPGDYQHRLFSYLKRMDDGRRVIVLGERAARWRAPRGYVEDVADAIACCVLDERAAGRIYNVADRVPLDEADWVHRIARATGWTGSVVTVPDDRLPFHLRLGLDFGQDLAVDSRRIRDELGYSEPTDPDEAMRRTVTWERANPPNVVDPAQFDYASEDAAIA